MAFIEPMHRNKPNITYFFVFQLKHEKEEMQGAAEQDKAAVKRQVRLKSSKTLYTHNTYSNQWIFLNFAQGMAVILSCSVQNFRRIQTLRKNYRQTRFCEILGWNIFWRENLYKDMGRCYSSHQSMGTRTFSWQLVVWKYHFTSIHILMTWLWQILVHDITAV